MILKKLIKILKINYYFKEANKLFDQRDLIKIIFYEKKDNIKYLKNISNVIRKNVVKMLSSAGSGHPGGSLSSTDILVSLYFSGYLNISKEKL